MISLSGLVLQWVSRKVSIELSAISYQHSAFSYQLSAFSHQLSAISHWPMAFTQTFNSH
ncbi:MULTISPECIES: hypothetical protein [unclassified Moorena]|uniref:Uncharacterized protein n=1 Tax=Moorena producens 3L TaxID=489825 RepID=F4XJ54_9CYAN|nr:MULTISPECIES: hypothetical protein [unclassified Moorena]EGJ35134.1 hypothetical protein LYNGBM3L_07340 [Moorena producens 3L]NEQ14461.1 hypothetical protein [Moorena sp. SIO3E2]